MTPTPDIQYFRDPLGRQIAISPYDSRGRTCFHVEVIDSGAVVDSYSLFSGAAIDYMKKKLSWEPW